MAADIINIGDGRRTGDDGGAVQDSPEMKQYLFKIADGDVFVGQGLLIVYPGFIALVNKEYDVLHLVPIDSISSMHMVRDAEINAEAERQVEGILDLVEQVIGKPEDLPPNDAA